MFTHKRFYYLVWGFVFGLTACSVGAPPQMIGSYPKDGNAGSVSGPAPANLLVVYNAYMEIEVSNVDAAAEQAKALAYNYGGYMTNAQSWYQEGRKYTTLTLAVPVAQFDGVHRSLLGLGRVVREDITGDRQTVNPGADGWNTFSQITVALRPAPSLLPAGWSLERAVGGFLEGVGNFVAGVLALGWMIVLTLLVASPFVFMVVGFFTVLRWLFRR